MVTLTVLQTEVTSMPLYSCKQLCTFKITNFLKVKEKRRVSVDAYYFEMSLCKAIYNFYHYDFTFEYYNTCPLRFIISIHSFVIEDNALSINALK